jgi:hypothetical protein
MLSWRGCALSLLIFAATVPSLGQGLGENSARPPSAVAEAQIDSLVWYVEQLEADLAKLELLRAAQVDSAMVENQFKDYKIEILEKNQRQWYDSKGLWFVSGVIMTLISANIIVD